jgi:ribosome maturation factor RimP
LPKERIQTVVEVLSAPLAEELGYELVEVEYRKEGRDWVLRCTIDSENGIGTEDCRRFSEALEILLDREDPIPGSYLLEVSSPGLDRPLKKERDYLRFVGSRVEIRLAKPLNNQKLFHGELLGMTEGDLKLVQLRDDQGKIVEIPFPEVTKAHLQMEFFAEKGGRKRK